MTQRQPASDRDEGLRRLARAKRWLLTGAFTLTGVLTAVAANAFPGKTISSSTQPSGATVSTSANSSRTAEPAAGAVRPSDTQESSSAEEPSSAQETSSAQESPTLSGQSEGTRSRTESAVVSGGS